MTAILPEHRSDPTEWESQASWEHEDCYVEQQGPHLVYVHNTCGNENEFLGYGGTA